MVLPPLGQEHVVAPVKLVVVLDDGQAEQLVLPALLLYVLAEHLCKTHVSHRCFLWLRISTRTCGPAVQQDQQLSEKRTYVEHPVLVHCVPAAQAVHATY